MSNYNSSQLFESYVPVYDAIPDDWNEAKSQLTEILKEQANFINALAIGYMLDQELISGFQFIPSQNLTGTSQQFRTVFRFVIPTGALVAGINVIPHTITFDSNFTLIDLWVAATDGGLLEAQVINGNDVVLDAANITITSPQAFDRSYAQVLYLQEL